MVFQIEIIDTDNLNAKYRRVSFIFSINVPKILTYIFLIHTRFQLYCMLFCILFLRFTRIYSLRRLSLLINIHSRKAILKSNTSHYNTHLRACNCAKFGTIFEHHVSAIASYSCVNLGTKTAGLCQAPFTTARPSAIVHHCGINSLAHHWFWLDAGGESSEINCASIVSASHITMRRIK